MIQQVAFIVVVTLIGVATLAFADGHESKKPVHSSSRSTTTPSRGPSVLSDEQALADEKAGDQEFYDELKGDLDVLMQVNHPEKPSSTTTGELSMPNPGHDGNPNLISMPR